MTEPDKIDLIYIASTGRSGSTLLEILLGSLDSIWTMGEIYVLPWEIQKERGTCGCGKKLSSCEFWTPIIREHRSTLELGGCICRFRDDYSISKFFKFGELTNILFRRSMPDKKLLGDFCSENWRLFSEVRRRAGEYRDTEISYLVDSSKIFYRLSWLLHCRSMCVKVIHIVKDPRSFVYSKIRKAKRPGGDLAMAVRMSMRYVVENYLIEKVVRTIPIRERLIVRYEDLAAYPDMKLEEITDWLGVRYKRDAIKEFRARKNHGVAGNIMRYGTNGIYLDEKWRWDMGSLNSRVVTVLTYFYARKYSYFSKAVL